MPGGGLAPPHDLAVKEFYGACIWLQIVHSNGLIRLPGGGECVRKCENFYFFLEIESRGCQSVAGRFEPVSLETPLRSLAAGSFVVSYAPPFCWQMSDVPTPGAVVRTPVDAQLTAQRSLRKRIGDFAPISLDLFRDAGCAGLTGSVRALLGHSLVLGRNPSDRSGANVRKDLSGRRPATPKAIDNRSHEATLPSSPPSRR